VLAASGLWRLAGKQIARWLDAPLLCSWALMWGLAAEQALKTLFGRYPPAAYRFQHIYGFRFLHGDIRLDVFPSGTAIAATSVAAVVWVMLPQLRFWAVFISLLLCAAVVYGTFHFLADVIAGAFIGSSIGWMTVQMQSREPT
jgi:membrane-associated phospholipid phosphatase